MGISCPSNVTIETFVLDRFYWRHSPMALETWRCKSSDDWTPCLGGTAAGNDGDGYCDNTTDGGYHGPRCELCRQSSRFFDRVTKRCKECSEVTISASIVGGCMMFVLIVASGVVTTLIRRNAAVGDALRHTICTLQKLWSRAGMRYKVKLIVGLYQVRTSNSNCPTPI